MNCVQVETVGLVTSEIPFVKALRLVGRMRLADAVAVQAFAATTADVVLVAGIDRPTAEHIAKAFTEAGVAVAIKPSSVGTPTVCRPEAATRYRWGPARTVVTD